MSLHQAIVYAYPGDAITEITLRYQEVLGRLGESRVFAAARHVDLADRVELIDDVEPATLRNATVLYHLSIGEQKLVRFLLDTKAQLVLQYHNITPAAFFESSQPGFAYLLDMGRRDLEVLRGRTALAMADSACNAKDLIDAGFPDPIVVTPPLGVLRLHRLDVEAEAKVLTADPRPLVLCVAQMLPHKGLHELIIAAHIVTTYHRSDVRFLFVGPNHHSAYAHALGEFARELVLPAVEVRGRVPEPELAALYQRADLLVTMSHHEGLCVPAIEAMSFGVPVIARAVAALPETVGTGGFLLPESAGPLAFAEAIALCLREPAIQALLRERALERSRHFDDAECIRDFLRAVAPVLS
ncbi:MAG: glycosyltransferase [Actinomycetota bacterium]